jgi:hypothetical protein
MYNVKRIGVWRYEPKRSRDWTPPPTLSHPLPIYLRYLLRAQFITNLRPEWTGSHHAKEGSQVSKRGIEKGARGIEKGARGISKGIAPCIS